MDIGTPCITRVNQSTVLETALMQQFLHNGMQLQVRPLPMIDHQVWIGEVITLDYPYWRAIVAGETATLALTALCRMVGAMDRIP